jgi:serine/threonine-protein kinase
VLDAAVLKAMAKSPVERYASADEFIAALERARDGLGAAPGRTEVRSAPTIAAVTAPIDEGANRRRRNWIIAACVLAALLLAGLAYFLTVGNKAEVPNVVGRSVGDAQSRLAEAGFKSQVFRQQTNKAPVDEVFKQSPSGGKKAKKGSTVILSVSSGPGTVSVPDVIGLSQADATQKLKALGLKVAVKKEYSSKVDKGLATRTVPAAAEKAEKGSTVDLYISRGPKQVVVPSVVGQNVDAATKTLEDAGFQVDTTTEDSPKPKDEVLKQSPTSGRKADDGSTVSLTVASGQNTVPDVTGLNEADATNELKDAGFKVTVTQTDVTDVADDGVVVTQSPQGGTHKVGSTVKIEIGVFAG